MSESKEIPIELAKEIAEKYGYDIIAIIGWNQVGNQHVTTFGQTISLCDWAARLGNKIKADILKWPDEFCHAEPKPSAIRKKYNLLLSEVKAAIEKMESNRRFYDVKVEQEDVDKLDTFARGAEFGFWKSLEFIRSTSRR